MDTNRYVQMVKDACTKYGNTLIIGEESTYVDSVTGKSVAKPIPSPDGKINPITRNPVIITTIKKSVKAVMETSDTKFIDIVGATNNMGTLIPNNAIRFIVPNTVDLKQGDEVVFQNVAHRVTRLEPYSVSDVTIFTVIIVET